MSEARAGRRKVLLLQLELMTWERARPLTYAAQFAIEDSLIAMGADVITVPAFEEIPCRDGGNWLSRLECLCGDETFDMAWLWVPHSHLDDRMLAWLSARAPVRVGFLIESLHYTAGELEENGTLRQYSQQITTTLPYLTHLLTVDEVDGAELNGLRGVRALWCPATVSRRALAIEPRRPDDSRAAFSGSTYGDRSASLADARLQPLLAHAQGPEERLGLAAAYDRLMLGMYAYLAGGGRADRQELNRWVGAWRTLRRAICDAYASSLMHWSGAVALPSLVKSYAGRVTEAMAVGRPVIAAEIAARPRNRALFEDGQDILLFDAARPDDLRGRLEQLAASPDLAARLTRRARARIEAFHTTELRIEQVVAWIDEGALPDYGDRVLRDAELDRLAAANPMRKPVDPQTTIDDVLLAISVLPFGSAAPDATLPILTPEVAIVSEHGRAVSIHNWRACVDTMSTLGERPIFCWGCGARGRALVRALAATGFAVEGFLDSDLARSGGSACGVMIHPPDLLTARSPDDSRPFVFVASMAALEILHALRSYGFHPPLDVLVV
jgi:glycosyl transferase family 1